MIPLANSETLIKFQDKKTGKIGVKTKTGKIIIPPKYIELFNRPESPKGDVIHEPFIEFTYSEMHHCDEKNSPIYAGGDVFDRKGNYLNSPMHFDMGMDYWQEGRRRFVEGCKVGFVNEQNQKIVPAEYDYATPFEYGYSTVIKGKMTRVKIDDEHFRFESSADAKEFVIDKTGKIASGNIQAQAHTDIKINGKYYPTPYYFANDFERKLANQLNGLDVLSDIALSHFYGISRAENPLNFQMTQRPSKNFPYYTLTGFTHDRHSPSEKITVYANLKGEFFVLEYQHDKEKEILKPLKAWVLDELNILRDDYFVRFPDAENRFDVNARIKQVQKMSF